MGIRARYGTSESPWGRRAEERRELSTHLTAVTGERPKALIRAEIVDFTTTAGGAAFSTGSITSHDAPSHHNYRNDVLRLLGNVLARLKR